MQRADKIALIVASVLVVALSAGAGLLLYQRSNTLAAERPVDAAVKLLPLEDTSTPAIEATAKPATVAAPKIPSRPKDADDFGYVTFVGKSGGDVYIKWDQAELLTGKEADVYAKKNGAVINLEPYYIANDTKKNKSYDLSSRAKIVVANADGTTTTLSGDEFEKDWNASGPSRKRPYWMFRSDGVVVRMEQVVLPGGSAQ